MTIVINRHGQITNRRYVNLRSTIAGWPAFLVGNDLYVGHPVGSRSSGWCLDGFCDDCRWAGCSCACHGEVS